MQPPRRRDRWVRRARPDAGADPTDAEHGRTGIDAELTAHGKPHEFHRYAGAGHAFLNFSNPERYRADQAADAWTKLLAFLDRQFEYA